MHGIICIWRADFCCQRCRGQGNLIWMAFCSFLCFVGGLVKHVLFICKMYTIGHGNSNILVGHILSIVFLIFVLIKATLTIHLFSNHFRHRIWFFEFIALYWFIYLRKAGKILLVLFKLHLIIIIFYVRIIYVSCFFSVNYDLTFLFFFIFIY
jgi:hypothetical protein